MLSRPHKKLVGASFNRAAPEYAEADALQREVGGTLLDRLDWLRLQPRCIVDAGCGVGRNLHALAKRYPKARVYGVDLAENMLKQARAGAPRWFSRSHFVCADAAALPLPDDCADLLVSNLMLQWCEDYRGVFEEFARVLKPGGTLLFSTFGPDTLKELREAWAAADSYVHVNDFTDMHDLGDALLQCGFSNPVMDSDRITLHYDDVYSLMRAIKQIGAHNLNQGRPRGLTGRGRLEAMLNSYEKLRKENGLPSHYEVLYGYAVGADHKERIKNAEVRVPVGAIKPNPNASS